MCVCVVCVRVLYEYVVVCVNVCARDRAYMCQCVRSRPCIHVSMCAPATVHTCVAQAAWDLWAGGNSTREHLREYTEIDMRINRVRGCPGAVPQVKAVLSRLAAGSSHAPGK